MKNFFDNFKKQYNLKNVFDKDLETRVGTIFLISGFVMASLAFILTLYYSFNWWVVLVNVLVAVTCLVIPMFSRDLKQTSFIMLLVVGVFYYPFIFLIVGGISGPAPIYFTVVIAYISLYLEESKARPLNIFLIIYFIGLVVVAEVYPNLVFDIERSFVTPFDISFAVVTVSVVIAFVSAATFRGYREEHQKNLELMKKLEESNKLLKELSILDQLTNVYNRRHFLEVIEKEIEHFEKYHQSFSLLMIDIDDFKNVNDEYGHLFGDDVLKKVCDEIKKNTRDYDLISRYGGEEFCVIVSHLNPEDSYTVAERIRLYVENIIFRKGLKITVSIGVADFENSDTVESIIQKADENLYKAKSKGKNNVVK